MTDLHKHEIKESVGHKGRATTTVTLLDLDCSSDESHIPLVELIGRLQEALAGIPEEFRNSATLNIKAYGDYANAYADVTFERPETDAELADRQRWLKSLDDEREDRDRREFDRLNRKFAAPPQS